MVGYTEVLQTIGAMVIFSLILLSATRMIQRNTLMQVDGELEQEVVALAQDIIEEARTKKFDEEGTVSPAFIPTNFTGPGTEGSEDPTKREDFDDFDDYNGWSRSIDTEHGTFDLKSEVFYVDNNLNKVAGPTTFKKIEVTVTSKFLKKGDTKTQYQFGYVRNYYAD